MKPIRLLIWSAAMAGGMLLAQEPASADVPRLMSYQGLLTNDAGQPLPGPVQIEVKLFDAAAGGTLLFTETHAGVPLSHGTFSISIGSETPGGVPDNALDRPEVWLGVTVDGGTEITPRTRIVMQAYAAKATSAEGLVRPGTFDRAMSVDAAGNVGIGFAPPLLRLQIDNEMGFGVSPSPFWNPFGFGILWRNGLITDSGAGIFGAPAGEGADLRLATRPSAGGLGQERMRVTSEGKVGIGTPFPQSKLDVNGDLRMTFGSGGQLFFADGSSMVSAGVGSAGALSSPGDAVVVGDSDANFIGDVVFKTGSNIRARISSTTGAMGIGGASIPGHQLHVSAGQPSMKGLVVRRAPGQVARLQEWQDEAGNTFGSVEASGEWEIGPPPGSVATRNPESPLLAGTRLRVLTGAASRNGVVVQGASGQTANLQEWHDGAGSPVATVGAGGSMAIGEASPSGQLSVRSRTSSTRGLVVRAAASQSAALQEWQDEAGTAVAAMDAVGKMGIGESSPTGQLSVRSRTSSTKGLVVRGAASQSAALQEWQDNGGNRLASVEAGGEWEIGPPPGSVATRNPESPLLAGTRLRVLTGASNSSGVVVRGATGQSANLQEWQDGAGSPVAAMGAGGSMAIGEPSPTGQLSVKSRSPSTRGLVVRAAPSQSAALQEWQDDAGSAVATMDGGGRMGIGESSPTGQLSVRSRTSSTKGLVVRGAASQSAALQEWQDNSGNRLASVEAGGEWEIGPPPGGEPASRDPGSPLLAGTRLRVLTGASNSSGVVVRGATGQSANLQEWQDGAGSPVAAVGAGGSMAIGEPSPSGQLSVKSRAASTKGLVVRGAASQSAALQEWQDDAGSVVAALDAAGQLGIGVATPTNILTIAASSATDPIADAWTQYSSKRWKTNIEPIPNALEKVERLRGVQFDWKSTGKHDIGLIAEEVGSVVPEVVTYEDNHVDARSVDYARLVGLLIEAVKEQQATIQKQQAGLRSLEAKLAGLEARREVAAGRMVEGSKANDNATKTRGSRMQAP